jgi:hypothetical protein
MCKSVNISDQFLYGYSPSLYILHIWENNVYFSSFNFAFLFLLYLMSIFLTWTKYRYIKYYWLLVICFWLRCLPSLTWRRKQIQFPNRCVFYLFFPTATQGFHPFIIYPPWFPNTPFAECIWMYFYRFQINWEIKKNLFGILDDDQSPETHLFWVLYTIVRTL